MKDIQAEIIVVDNDSKDGSQAIVKEYFPAVRLVCNGENIGFAKANNIGIKESTGKYVCLVNSDVEVQKNCLKEMIGFMGENQRIGVLGPKTYNSDGSLQRSCFGFPNAWNTFCRALALDSIFPRAKVFGGRLMKFWDHDYIRSVDILNGCFLMVKREIFKKVGLLDEDFFFYGEDMDWCKRIRNSGWDIVFFPKAEIIHYGGASSSNSPVRFYVEMYRADYQYWKKHNGRFAGVDFIALAWVHMLFRIIGMSAVYLLKPDKRKEAVYKIRRSVACLQWLLNGKVSQESYGKS
jgi:GT2 family glycosyltransferase